jgi:hypothetical protein
MSSWILNGSIGFKPAVQPHENMPMTQSPLLRCSFPPTLQEWIHQAHIFDTAESRVLAIHCLNRQRLTALHRVGLRYQINLMNQGGLSVRRSNIGKSRMLNIGNAPALCEVLSRILVRL